MADVDLNAVVAAYTALRDKKKEIVKAHNKELDVIDDMLERTETFLMTHLNTVQSESVRTKAGTFFKHRTTSGTVASRETFLEWVKKNNEWDLIDVRAAKANIEAYKTKHNDLPPGINWREEVVINVRKAAGNGKEETPADGGVTA